MSNKSLKDKFKKADDLLEKGDFLGTIEIYNEIVEETDDLAAYYGLINVYKEIYEEYIV